MSLPADAKAWREQAELARNEARHAYNMRWFTLGWGDTDVVHSWSNAVVPAYNSASAAYLAQSAADQVRSDTDSISSVSAAEEAQQAAKDAMKFATEAADLAAKTVGGSYFGSFFHMPVAKALHEAMHGAVNSLKYKCAPSGNVSISNYDMAECMAQTVVDMKEKFAKCGAHKSAARLEDFGAAANFIASVAAAAADVSTAASAAAVHGNEHDRLHRQLKDKAAVPVTAVQEARDFVQEVWESVHDGRRSSIFLLRGPTQWNLIKHTLHRAETVLKDVQATIGKKKADERQRVGIA
jgi:hypothetical protein